MPHPRCFEGTRRHAPSYLCDCRDRAGYRVRSTGTAAGTDVSEGAELTDFASLKAAAEAIDPLAEAAKSEGAWSVYLEALEAENGPAEEQAHALNRIGDSRYYQQDIAGALASSLEAEKRLIAAGATDGEAMAGTLANIATFYTGVGQPEKNVPLQERSLKIRTGLYGQDPEGIAPADAKALGLGYLNYAAALYEANRFGDAAEYVDLAIKGLIRGGMTDTTLFVALDRSEYLHRCRSPGRCLASREAGIAMANELLPEEHLFHGFAQGTLAKVLLQAGRYEEAEQPARSALDIMTERLGPTHRNTWSHCTIWAWSRCASGSMTKASHSCWRGTSD